MLEDGGPKEVLNLHSIFKLKGFINLRLGCRLRDIFPLDQQSLTQSSIHCLCLLLLAFHIAFAIASSLHLSFRSSYQVYYYRQSFPAFTMADGCEWDKFCLPSICLSPNPLSLMTPTWKKMVD